MNKDKALQAISDELDDAVKKFSYFHSAHEGWGVIREEYLELEKEIMASKPSNPNIEAMRDEAIQLGAMTIRFLMDIIK